MFGILLSACEDQRIFFNKKITKFASKDFRNMRGNFAIFGGIPDSHYFAIAPLWLIEKTQLILV